jgi:hypothetical protein
MQLWVMDERGVHRVDQLFVGQDGKPAAYQGDRKVELSVPAGWSRQDILFSARTALQTNQVLDLRSPPTQGPINLPLTPAAPSLPVT